MEKRAEIVVSRDGSLTYHSHRFDESYHSQAGALTETNHIFIKCGLEQWIIENSPFKNLNITLLEAGFGSGLNTIATLYRLQQLNSQLAKEALIAQKEPPKIAISYTSLELYPLSLQELNALNHSTLFPSTFAPLIEKIYSAPWDSATEITESFTLHKINQNIVSYFEERSIPSFKEESGSYLEKIDILYWDAFSPRKQPELWSEELFKAVESTLKSGSLLVTYSVQSKVRKALANVGLSVEKLPGPPGKREIAVAKKES